jgi:hypothetical protein
MGDDHDEADVLTEASRTSRIADEMAQNDHTAPLAPEHPAHRLAERLREATVQAPLQSLAIAFLLGLLFSRRRQPVRRY